MSKCIACPNIVSATSIVTANGVTTITVPSTFIPSVCNCYCILLRVPIPTGTECNSIVVTNGTSTWSILICNGNNYRPSKLKCRSILQVKYLSDPAHFLLERVRK